MTESGVQSATDGQAVRDLLEPTLQEIDQALGKEGASLDLTIDPSSRTVTATLVRHRITCEGCLLPADLVSKMLSKSLKADPEIRQLRYKIKTENWLA